MRKVEGGLRLAVKQSTERTYRFPPQETKLRSGKRPCMKPADLPETASLVSLDVEAGTLVLRLGKKSGSLPDRLDLLPEKPLRNSIMRDAIAAVSDGIVANDGRHQATEHLLTRTPPQFSTGPRLHGIINPDKDLVGEIHQAIADMDRTTLAIQGPPGREPPPMRAIDVLADLKLKHPPIADCARYDMVRGLNAAA